MQNNSITSQTDIANVTVITDERQIIVPQAIINVVEVNTPGPRGPQGPAGSSITGGATNYIPVWSSTSSLTTSSIYVSSSTVIITGSLSVSGSITSSLFGTASWAINALTASYALNGGGGATFPYSGSAVITGSLVVSGSKGGINTYANNPALFDQFGIDRVRWTEGILRSSGNNATVNWESKTLNDSTGIAVVDWGNKALYDSAGNASINWTNRTLSEATTTWVALDYSGEGFLDSQIYYRNIIPAQVQRTIANGPATYYGGQVIEATVDVGVTDFQLVFLDTDGTWKATKATVTSGADKMLGICVEQGSGYELIEGDIGVSDDNSQGAYVIGPGHGLPVYVSATTGVMTTTQPSNTGELVRIVGHTYYKSATDANWWTMKFRPSNNWFEQ